jgi:hypothetical protein
VRTADITRALRERYPGVSITTRRHPVLAGHWIVAMPQRTAAEIHSIDLAGAVEGGDIQPASRTRASELLSRWIGSSVWVADVRRMADRITRGPRFEITLRDEASLGESPAPAVMQLWRGNKVSEPFTMTLEELASGYLKSRYAATNWPLDRSLALYLADPAFINGSWTDQRAYTALRKLVLEKMT